MLRKAMRDALHDGYDPGDAWGSVMGAWFDIADILTWEGLPVPAEWKYRRGYAYQSTPESALFDYWLMGYVDYYDLLDAGNLLQRASHILKAEGRDY